jgi:hypothetical protein
MGHDCFISKIIYACRFRLEVAFQASYLFAVNHFVYQNQLLCIHT